MIKLRNKPSRADRAHSLALKEPRPHCVFKGIPLVWANRWISLGVSVVYTSFRCLVANQRVFYEALVWLWEVRLRQRAKATGRTCNWSSIRREVRNTSPAQAQPHLHWHHYYKTHTTHMLMIMYLHNKSWCSYTSLFPHCSCGPYRPHRQIWTGTDWYVHKPTVISRQQLVRESDVGEQYRAIDTWLCLYNYWLCRSILYSLCCCIVALQMSVVPAVLCPLSTFYSLLLPFLSSSTHTISRGGASSSPPLTS